MMLRKLAFSLFLLLGFSEIAAAGNAAIFNGQFVKLLKDQLKLSETAYILTGTDDPTSVAKDAPEGSLYLRDNIAGDGQLYVKLDSGSTTNWSLLAAGITAVVDDLSPQLGGDLDLNTFDITEGATLILHLTGPDSIYVGEGSGASATGGGNGMNSCFGKGSCASLTEADSTSAFGDDALSSITTQDGFTAFGRSAYASLTSLGAARGVAIGNNSAVSNTNSTDDVIIGANAHGGTASARSVVVGSSAASGGTSVPLNSVHIGFSNSSAHSSGTDWTVVGYNACDTPSTVNNVTCVGANADTTGNFVNAAAWGHGALVDAANKHRFGDDDVTEYEYAPSSTLSGPQAILHRGTATTSLTVAAGETLRNPFLSLGGAVTYTVTGRLMAREISGTGAIGGTGSIYED